MRYCVVIFLLLLSCNKPDPAPELKDPIYLDLEKSKKEIEGLIAVENKNLEEFQTNFDRATPQTGQIKYAQKRLFESQNRMNKLKQQLTYFEIAIESRRTKSRIDYLIAFNKKSDWPDQKEVKDYFDQKKLGVIKKSWNAKDRIEEFNKEHGQKK